MKKLLGLLSLALAFVLMPGRADAQCAVAAAHTHGCIVTVMKGPLKATELEGASKVGKTCAHSVLGLVGWGDASIDTAKKAGGITKVAAVSYDTLEVLPYWGIYGQFCTFVAGD